MVGLTPSLCARSMALLKWGKKDSVGWKEGVGGVGGRGRPAFIWAVKYPILAGLEA